MQGFRAYKGLEGSNESAGPLGARGVARMPGARRPAPHSGGSCRGLLRYLEAFPTGVHNRSAAQRIEDLLDVVVAERRSVLHARFRAVRDAVLPALELGPWPPALPGPVRPALVANEGHEHTGVVIRLVEPKPVPVNDAKRLQVPPSDWDDDPSGVG